MTPEEEAAKQAAEAEINQILFKDSKSFVDSHRFYVAKEYMALRLNIGPQAYTFALTPYSSKLLSNVLSAQIKNWEEQFGEIILNSGQPIQSPIQMDDLGDTDAKDKEDPNPDKRGPKKK